MKADRINQATGADIASQIKKLREKRRMSQKEFATKLGTKQERVCLIENPANSSMTIKTLSKIAAALGCDLVVQLVERV